MAEDHVSRLAATRERMRAHGFDALVVVDPANLHYLTGYDAWSFYMPQLLFVPLEGDVLFITRHMDAVGAHRTADLPPDQILGYPEDLIHRRDRHPFDWAATQLRDRGHATAMRVGYEGEAHFFSPRSFAALAQGLPEWTMVDDHDLVGWVRLVKSPAELELMRGAGRIASAVMAAGIDAIRVGVPQHELAAVIQAAQARGVDGAAGDYPSIVPLLPTAEAADTPHLTWSARRLVADEGVSLELAGVHRRYHAPLARTVSLGRPSRELDRIAGVTADGLELVLGAMRPGVQVREVVSGWTSLLARAGLEKESRLGYSVGIGYPPDWGERTVSIRDDDETVLEAGMCFHVIAGMWMRDYGCEISETVAVADDGIEVLTSAPRQLIVKEAA
ncbi:M24 family metallopeptidase [Agromyces laixinhei]|uniref:M24 family metallopeptidase n=1 Tax=Agromyces laixinhei TaxID=2585717 RepID=UPI0012ED58A9|nr:M24 family metallopeptidase [Agromyces laixinhei]